MWRLFPTLRSNFYPLKLTMVLISKHFFLKIRQRLSSE